MEGVEEGKGKRRGRGRGREGERRGRGILRILQRIKKGSGNF